MKDIYDITAYTPEGSEQYRYRMNLDRIPLTIRVASNPEEPPAQVEARMQPNLRYIFQKGGFLMEEIIAELLPLKNESWLQEGEEPATKLSFYRNLNLFDVSIDLEGSARITYYAGRLFWGHEVVAVLDDQQVLDFVTLQG